MLFLLESGLLRAVITSMVVRDFKYSTHRYYLDTCWKPMTYWSIGYSLLHEIVKDDEDLFKEYCGATALHS